MRLLVAFLAALAPLVFAVPASASQQPWQPDALVRGATAAASADWAALGQTPPPFAEWALTDSDIAFAGVVTDVRRLVLNSSWLAQIEADARNRADDYVQWTALRQLCAAIEHEEGHMLGYVDLDPAPNWGIMTGDWANVTLPHCASWAQSIMPPSPLTRKKGFPVPSRPMREKITDDYKLRAFTFAQRQKERLR